MKKLTILKKGAVLVGAALLLNCMNIHAQPNPCFVPATLSENLSGTTSTGIGNTGNDTRDYTGYGIGYYRASVWDGSSPGISWQVDDMSGTYIGSSALAVTDALDPDVVIAYDGCKVYALVVFYVPSSTKYLFNVWYWNGSAFQDLGFPFPTYDASSSFGQSYNIDANAKGDFVIVWDNTGTGQIHTIAGTCSNCNGPKLCTSSFVALPNSGHCIAPDVTIGDCGYIHYTYLNSSANKIYVTIDKHYYICNNSPNNYPDWGMGASAGEGYDHPRISCPNFNGPCANWSVVWLKAGNGAYEVFNNTRYNGADIFHNYTDGSEGNCAMYGDYHKYPVISYDWKYNGFLVAWNCFWPYDASFTPDAPVGLQCNQKGYLNDLQIHIMPYNHYTGKEYVPSLSGRDNPYMFATYVDTDYPDVMFKDIKYTNFFRTSDDKSGSAEITIKASPNPFSEQVNLSFKGLDESAEYLFDISDITGRNIMTTTAIPSIISGKINSSLKNFNAGCYLITVKDKTGNQLANTKLVKY